MSNTALIQSLNLDLQSINDLAFDEDCEIFLQLGRSRYSAVSYTDKQTALGLLGFLAAVIWLMNSRHSWQEIFEMLNGPLSVLSEGERVRSLEIPLALIRTH